MVAAHVVDCSPRSRNEMCESKWESWANYIVLGITAAHAHGWLGNTGNTPIHQRMVAAHVVDCSPRARKVLKSDWKVEAMSPGVADHSTLGIPQYASGWWLRT